MLENEIWKTIEGFEDYQVSNFGRVKSFKCGKSKILKNSLNLAGYCVVSLFKDKKKITKKIHKLVAIAFLNHNPCGMKLVVNHKDFDKQNNNLKNLEIVTSRENCNKKHIKSASKYTGVSWNKDNKKWRAKIDINRKCKHLGYFINMYDAHIAYENKLKELTNV